MTEPEFVFVEGPWRLVVKDHDGFILLIMAARGAARGGFSW